MSHSRRVWLTRLVLLAPLWPAIAAAQPVEEFEDLAAIAKARKAVVVTDVKGDKISGRLISVEKDSLSLNATHGPLRTIRWSEVDTIRAPDSLANGVLIGAAAGFGSALSILAVAGSQDGYVLPAAKVAAPLLLSGVGALAGALIDRAYQDRIFHRHTRQSRLSVSPFVGAGRRGVLLSLRLQGRL